MQIQKVFLMKKSDTTLASPKVINSKNGQFSRLETVSNQLDTRPARVQKRQCGGGILAPAGPIPVSKSTWWAGIKDGRFPAPQKLGPRTSVWRVEYIRALFEEPLNG